MIAVTRRLSATGISKDVKRQIRTRYLEYVAIFVSLSYPINNMIKPEYSYNADLGLYVGGTRFAVGWRISICGFGII